MSDLPGSLSRSIQALTVNQDIPPVELWDPDFQGSSEMTIDTEGRWFYKGSEMERAKLVRLFSTILRREADGCYYLVTPVEKLSIAVEDSPFVAIDVEFLPAEDSSQKPALRFTTNVGDQVIASPDHPIELLSNTHEQEVPYITVRAGLRARIGRNLFYYLVEHFAEELLFEGRLYLGVFSSENFYPLGTLTED